MNWRLRNSIMQIYPISAPAQTSGSEMLLAGDGGERPVTFGVEEAEKRLIAQPQLVKGGLVASRQASPGSRPSQDRWPAGFQNSTCALKPRTAASWMPAWALG